MRVADVMSTPVIALTPTATVAEAVEVMLSRGYTSLPVIDEDDRLIAVVTEADLGLARFGQYPRRGDAHEGGAGPTVSAIMGRRFASISPDGELTDAAAAMAGSHQRCLPVTRDLHVVGMITWRDLLRVSVSGDTAAQHVTDDDDPAPTASH